MGFIDFFYTDQTFYRPMHKKIAKNPYFYLFKVKEKKNRGGRQTPPSSQPV